MSVAQEALAVLTERGQSLATAESLTAGLLAAAVADVPGASAVLRGGVVSYSSEVKAEVLGVPEDLLARQGSVDPEVARAMAAGARRVCRSDWALATTGVAGPQPHDGQPVGTVFLGLAAPDGSMRSRRLSLAGDRATIRRQTVERALAWLLEELAEGSAGSDG